MANSSMLHLVVEKGPKQGETLTHRPGTLIRIGRVVKGNTFTIKDPAISQKHLSIEFMPEISKWAVKDLDTSNGTLVNDVKIPPLNPFPLSSGDTVKIGESTSITVVVDSFGNESDGGVMRGRRGRGIRDPVEEEKCVEDVKNLEFGRSRRGNSSRASKKDEILDDAVNDNVKMRSRRGNSSKVSKNGEILNAVVEECVQLRPKRGVSSQVSKKDELLDDVVDESIKLRPGRGNSSTALRKDENSNVFIKESVEVRPRRAGLRSRAKEVSLEKEKQMENENIDVDAKGNIELPKNVNKGKSKEAPARTRASPAKILQSEDKGEVNGETNETGVEEEKEIDLEKMTLGEWFDSMEKYLPNAINEVAEQMIESLKEKARRFDEYVANISDSG